MESQGDPQLEDRIEGSEELDKFNKEYKQLRRRNEDNQKKKIIKEKIETEKKIEAALEKDQNRHVQDALTSDLFCARLLSYKETSAISEQQEKLCLFTKRCIIEENEKCPMADVQLTLDFSFEGANNLTIIHGKGSQKVRSFFDEEEKPRFQWESTSKKRRIMVFFRTFFKTENVKDMVKKLISNPKSIFQDVVNAVNSAVLLFTVLRQETIRKWRTK